MGKIAILFAGQGAQQPGMGQALAQCSAAARAVFDTADAVRPGTSAQCFAGTPEELCRTVNTQPCLFAVDLAAACALEEAGVEADMAAGFSLGEVAALTFGGAFSTEEGFRLVCRRGELMEEAAQRHPGAMAAVLKLQNAQVEEICRGFDHMYPVNYNCSGQLVVAGAAGEMDAFRQAVAQAGGRATPLAVGGGFHSPFMDEAAAGLAQVLGAMEMAAPRLPVYANRTAAPYGEGAKDQLASQVNHPVRWEETILAMAQAGADTFIEVGPGKTLTGLMKRIVPTARALRVEDEATLRETLAAL